VTSTAHPGPQRLLLWDIDGTLLAADDVDDEVFDRALELALGRRPPSRVAMGGKTDLQIAQEYLAMLGVPGGEAQVAAVLGHLRDEMAAAEEMIRGRDRVLPGVAELLARLACDPRTFQTVLTGNIAPNAVVKLAVFGLDRWLDLPVGAYGSDHADRNRLVPVALDRVASRRGFRFGPEEVWVIGDSANDLACARVAGARCLLVATGRTPLVDLAALGPDACRSDLAAVGEVVALFAT